MATSTTAKVVAISAPNFGEAEFVITRKGQLRHDRLGVVQYDEVGAGRQGLAWAGRLG